VRRLSDLNKWTKAALQTYLNLFLRTKAAFAAEERGFLLPKTTCD